MLHYFCVSILLCFSEDENCGAGWKENPKTGRCYRTGDEKLCWSDAVSACGAYGGTLFVIQDAEEFNFVKGIFKARSDHSGQPNFTILPYAVPIFYDIL